MRKPAAFGGRVRLPPTTLPSRLTAIMSEALRRPKWTPRAKRVHSALFLPEFKSEPTICPEDIMGLGVPDTDVSRDAFHKAFPCPVSECCCHVFELPLSLGRIVGAELWDAGEHHVAVADGREWALVFHSVDVLCFILRGDGFGDNGEGREKIADCRGSHDLLKDKYMAKHTADTKAFEIRQTLLNLLIWWI